VASCRECGAAIGWVPLVKPVGRTKPHPVDPGDVWPPTVELVALNPDTGKGLVVTMDDIETGRVQAWADRGVVFRRSHFETCPFAQRVREASPRQEALF
jgi:hypothetical protein